MKKTILLLAAFFIFQNNFAQSGLCFTYASYSPLSPTLYSFGLTKADYNNDGQIDFLSHFPGATYFSVTVSNGTGSYLPATTFTFSAGLSYAESGDFNNDGKQDVVIAYQLNNNVEILLGTGTGSFVSLSTYSVGTYPTAIICKDLNNDLNTDIVVCNKNSSNISVLLGNGSGGFSNSVNYSVGANPHDIVAGDFNNDNKLDLAVATNSLVILQGNGAGIFNLNSTLYFGFGNANGNSGYAFKTVDFSGDNKLDLAGIFGDTLYYTKGNGNFTFGVLNKTYVGSQAFAIDYADFNNDGKIDFVTSNYSSKDYSILLGNSLGTFTNVLTYTISASFPNFSPVIVITTDVNNDGKSDIIIGHDNCLDLTVILNCNSVNVGIKDYTDVREEYNLYPNPANDVLNIEFNLGNKEMFSKIRILNNVGQLIREEEIVFKNKGASIKTNDLPNGVYLLNLKSTNSLSVSKRFVVAR